MSRREMIDGECAEDGETRVEQKRIGCVMASFIDASP